MLLANLEQLQLHSHKVDLDEPETVNPWVFYAGTAHLR